VRRDPVYEVYSTSPPWLAGYMKAECLGRCPRGNYVPLPRGFWEWRKGKGPCLL